MSYIYAFRMISKDGTKIADIFIFVFTSGVRTEMGLERGGSKGIQG
jgi:hypothetical protein